MKMNMQTTDKLTKLYKELIEKEQNYIKQQCLDFSQIPAVTKRALKDFLLMGEKENYWANQDNNIVYDNFLIIKGLYTLKKIRANNRKNKAVLTKKDYAKNRTLAHNIVDDDKAYTYSTKQTRELLYLCSLYNLGNNDTLLDKVSIKICLEKVKLDNPSVNLSNIKYIVNNLSIDYICVNIAE